MLKNWNWQTLKDTIGFKTFKDDYIRIFEQHHSKLIKTVSGYRQPRIFKTSDHIEESILNYINTNVSAYSIMVNESLNRINFDPTTKEGYSVMMTYILENQSFWLEILPKINDKILYTSSLGKDREDLVLTKLTEHFSSDGKYKVLSIGDLGNLTDMVSGVDMIIRSSKKDYLVQIKSCKSIDLINDSIYKINYTGINKLYRGIDYMIFVKDKRVHVFKNDMILKDINGYQINREGLKMIL
jgi:hypothetical protein